MAENETLDLWGRKSRRWVDLSNLIRAGATDEAIARSIERCLYRTFQNVAKQVPLGPLLKAAVSDEDVTELMRQSEFNEYACLAKQVALPDMEIVAAAEQLVLATRDRFLDQIKLKVVGSDNWPNFESFNAARDRWKGKASNKIRELASKIAQSPATPLRMPRTSKATKLANLKRMAGLSLLKP